MVASATSTGQRLTSILEGLGRSMRDLVAAGLGDANGLPIAFVGPRAEKEAATAMASLLLGAAGRTAAALGLHGVRDLLIDVDGFVVLVHPVVDRYVLIAILPSTGNVGLARLQLQSCAEDVQIALDGE